jgi:hypothetical protein
VFALVSWTDDPLFGFTGRLLQPVFVSRRTAHIQRIEQYTGTRDFMSFMVEAALSHQGRIGYFVLPPASTK